MLRLFRLPPDVTIQLLQFIRRRDSTLKGGLMEQGEGERAEKGWGRVGCVDSLSQKAL